MSFRRRTRPQGSPAMSPPVSPASTSVCVSVGLLDLLQESVFHDSVRSASSTPFFLCAETLSQSPDPARHSTLRSNELLLVLPWRRPPRPASSSPNSRLHIPTSP